MSNYLNEGLIIDPNFRVLSVKLAANNTVDRKRGSVICKKGFSYALHDGTVAANAVTSLTVDATNGDDGTLDIYGVSGYTVPFGILLDDVAKDASATPTVNVLVSGVVCATLCGKQDSGAWKYLKKSAYATDPDGEDNILIRRLRDFGIIAQ